MGPMLLHAGAFRPLCHARAPPSGFHGQWAFSNCTCNGCVHVWPGLTADPAYVVSARIVLTVCSVTRRSNYPDCQLAVTGLSLAPDD